VSNEHNRHLSSSPSPETPETLETAWIFCPWLYWFQGRNSPLQLHPRLWTPWFGPERESAGQQGVEDSHSQCNSLVICSIEISIGNLGHLGYPKFEKHPFFGTSVRRCSSLALPDVESHSLCSLLNPSIFKAQHWVTSNHASKDVSWHCELNWLRTHTLTKDLSLVHSFHGDIPFITGRFHGYCMWFPLNRFRGAQKPPWHGTSTSPSTESRLRGEACQAIQWCELSGTITWGRSMPVISWLFHVAYKAYKPILLLLFNGSMATSLEGTAEPPKKVQLGPFYCRYVEHKR